jgi:hypothetical protein
MTRIRAIVVYFFGSAKASAFFEVRFFGFVAHARVISRGSRVYSSMGSSFVPRSFPRTAPRSS